VAEHAVGSDSRSVECREESDGGKERPKAKASTSTLVEAFSPSAAAQILG